ncbi:head maturation protease, ClpP-related [Thiobacillus denitrificans]|uniref:head maturation protease, ClpP-related n=1 Tax=Thiobacillus denitrificans TaxID=36861 RepID=UPI000752BD12|nr:head maturation protease, ClpP-related [Thiobacillus denitrificans]
MKKSWFTVQALADGRTAQVSVRGYIGEWGITDREFIAAVESHGEVDTIEVAINSRGGEVDHALSIFNFLKNHPARVNMRVDGVAMSAASIILMAGDEIAMPANAILMIHSPWSYASGNADDLRQAADVLDVFESALLETYQARSGKTADELKTMLSEETFMTAKEAVAHGFADRVIPLKAEARAASAVAYAAALNIPLDVLVRAQAEALADAEGGDDPPAAPLNPADDPADDPAMSAAQAVAIPASLSSRIATAASDAGLTDFMPCFALDAALIDMPAVQQAMADAREVFDLCALVGMAEQAEPLIRQRASLADARKTLQTRMAALDESSHTDSTPALQLSQSVATGEKAASASSIWASRRAAAHS